MIEDSILPDPPCASLVCLSPLCHLSPFSRLAEGLLCPLFYVRVVFIFFFVPSLFPLFSPFLGFPGLCFSCVLFCWKTLPCFVTSRSSSCLSPLCSSPLVFPFLCMASVFLQCSTGCFFLLFLVPLYIFPYCVSSQWRSLVSQEGIAIWLRS